MSFEVKKAKRQRRPLKINLEGVSGSGKSFSALRLAFAMRRAGIGRKIVVADSENESAGLYEGVVQDGERWEYDVCPIPPEKQNPLGYVEAYEYLVGEGFDIVIGDSLTHAWYGAQEIVDRYAQNNKGDKFGGWANVTPQHRKLLATLTDARAHFIGTMRVKSEYERQERENGRGSVIKKVGTKTDQREGAEYEFDCVVRMDKGDIPTDHVIVVDKVRGCTAMDGRRGVNPGPDFWKPLFDWWLSAEPATPLHERHADAIRAAADIDALKGVMERVNLDARAQRLSPEQIAALGRLKDDRKAQLSSAAKPAPAAAPEGEQGSDPTPPAAPTVTRPTPTSTAPQTTPAPGPTTAPEPAAKSSPVPKHGADLPAWLDAAESRLVERDLCSEGALKARVLEAASARGAPADVDSWGADAVELAVKTAREFESLVARPEAAAVRAELARTRKKWSLCCTWLNARFNRRYDGRTKLWDVPAEELAALAADLQTHAAPAQRERAGVA